MTTAMNWVPILSSIIALVFAVTVLRRYLRRRSLPMLFWGIGLTMYGIAALCEALYAVLGWNPLIFRLWYLLGAVLVAAWLGQGTVYLLASKRVAHILALVLVIGSLYGAMRVFSAALDPNLLTEGELSGHAIVTPGVRILTPLFNVSGLAALAGGAGYSAWVFWRKRVMPNRVIGNILIALGAVAPGLGGLFSRLGIAGYLYLGELLGALLMYAGFLRSTAPADAQERSAGPEGNGNTLTATTVETLRE